MRVLFVTVVLVLSSLSLHSQQFKLFGPRAGFGYLNKSSGHGLQEGAHTAFGWQMEVAYPSKEFTGYGEAGFLFLGIEQGILYPHMWGFFGVRFGGVGFGAGPVIDPMGPGLGLNTYLQFETETLRIPLGITYEFIDSKTRIQLLIGFNYK